MPRAATMTAPEPASEQDAMFVSTKETARLLGLSRNHVYELLDRREIESRYIGRRRLVVMSSLRAFVDQLPTERAG